MEALKLSREDICRLIDAMDYQRWNDRELTTENIDQLDQLVSILRQKETEEEYSLS